MFGLRSPILSGSRDCGMDLVFPPSPGPIPLLSPSPSSFKCQRTSAHFPFTVKPTVNRKPCSCLPNSNSIFHQTPFPPSSNTSKLTSSAFIATKRTTSTNAVSSTSADATTLESDTTARVPPSNHWIVVMEKPPNGIFSKSDVIDYYVQTLATVLESEKEAQMCIYHASWETHFGFCCDIDERTARRIAGMPGVLSVRPDKDFQSIEKDYSISNFSVEHLFESSRGTHKSLAEGASKYWLVRMEKPPVVVVTKAQMVDYFCKTLMKVLGNEKDSQMCVYHISWSSHFGFCCELDEECARELAGVPGVISVKPDLNYQSDYKDYGDADELQNPGGLSGSSGTNQTPNIRTKRLFVTGLSFYTSEKTLRAAFEGFGELVEVKIIMDKISKRSKGYAFLEYTTEEAAGAALKEMNGKIINGWMIVVDVAKSNPPRYQRDRRQPRV